jgi:hypothetical protein
MGGFFGGNNAASTPIPGVVTITPVNTIVTDTIGSWCASFVIPGGSLADGFGLVGGYIYGIFNYTGATTLVKPVIGMYNTTAGAGTAQAPFIFHSAMTALTLQGLSYGFAFTSQSGQLFIDAVVGCGGNTTSTLGNTAQISQAVAGIDLTQDITVEVGVLIASSVVINHTDFFQSKIYMVPSS